MGFLHAAECFTPDLLVPLSDEMPAAAADPRVRVGVTRSLRYMLTSLPCPIFRIDLGVTVGGNCGLG